MIHLQTTFCQTLHLDYLYTQYVHAIRMILQFKNRYYNTILQPRSFNLLQPSNRYCALNQNTLEMSRGGLVAEALQVELGGKSYSLLHSVEPKIGNRNMIDDKLEYYMNAVSLCIFQRLSHGQRTYNYFNLTKQSRSYFQTMRIVQPSKHFCTWQTQILRLK